MRIAFVMARSSADRPSHMPEVARWLTEWGAIVDVIHSEERVVDLARLRVEHDLYVLRDKSDLALSLAGALHTAGAAILNPYPVCAAIRDKIVMFRVLQAAGVPTPEAFVASRPEQLRAALQHGPLIIRSHRHAERRSVQVIPESGELPATGRRDEPVFAQRYHEPEGRDRKLYAIGNLFFGVKRVSPARTHEEKLGEPFRLSPELREVVLACGRAFGIDLFGVDVVESGGRAYVVDMSSFPGFKGVPNAPLRLADYIYAAAERVVAGEPLLPQLPTEAPWWTLPRREPRVRVAQPGTPVRDSEPRHRETPYPRVAMYSQGMLGFGHIRRNATIAHGLRRSALQPVVVMIAEAWQAGAIPMPPGVDCVTLPGLRKGLDGAFNPRSLDVSDEELVALRAKVIRTAIRAFEPDVFIVDHLPLGAARELGRTLERLRKHGQTRCVLGLRDVLQDRAWSEAYVDAMRDYYDAIWVYGDPAVYDAVREDGAFEQVAGKVRYTGYLDQRSRLEFAGAQATALAANLPAGQVALCVVGGGHDGHALAEAFVKTDLPADTVGVVVTGPYMSPEMRQRLHQLAEGRPRVEVLDFVPEPAALIERADRIVAMGGYNTMCEVLSFEKHALIVPRVHPEPEQWIRARRMRDLGLVEVLHPDDLTPGALADWLARDLGPPPASRSRIDVGGLDRIPGLMAELLGVSASPVQPTIPAPAAAVPSPT